MNVPIDELESQIKQNPAEVKKAMAEHPSVNVEKQEISPASDLMEKIKKDLKPTKISKTYSVSLQDKAGIWRKFETTMEASVVDNVESSGRILFDLVRAAVDEDAKRVLGG